jgi:hypothetical protein
VNKPSKTTLKNQRDNEKPVDAVYCDAEVNGVPIYLILDSGSVGSVITKEFAQKVGLEISGPSKTNMIDIHGGKKRALGIIKDVPVTVKGRTITVDMEVTEAKEYTILVGNDWLDKVGGIIDYPNRLLAFQWDGMKCRTPITCWKRPEFQEGKPVGLEQNQQQKETPEETEETWDSEDEYESEPEDLEDKIYCAILGDDQTPLATVSEKEIAIGDRLEPKEYLEDLKMYTNTELINDKGLERHWKGPNAICWCDKVLETSQEKCDDCKLKHDDWELLKYMDEDMPDYHQPNTKVQLTESQQGRLDELLEQNQDLFVDNAQLLGRTDVEQHRVIVENEHPIRQKAYRVSPNENQFIDGEIRRMLDQGIIRPSKSPWTSPVVLVSKKNGKTRFCVDYRKLNSVTKKDAYSLPRIDEILDSMHNAKWFTSLDLASGYWQVGMDPRDRDKTAFITKQGTFEFNVMPFGLTNAPATFQRVMDKIFYEVKEKYVLVYLDDINIYSTSFEEHLEHLQDVFNRLRDAGLKLGPDKCHFCKRELGFLGHVISAEGIAPDPAKVDKVQNFPVPTNLTELRGFIGLASYYRRFIQDFAQIAAPMNKLLKKDTPYIWSKDCQKAFEFMKNALTSAPILRYPNFEEPFILYTDASYTGLGAVLAQKDEEGLEHVIAYASRSLDKAEQNYSATEIECLAAVWGMKYFRPYIYQSQFELVTDHSALKWMLNKADPNKRVARWLMAIMDYPYTVKHRAGKRHLNADALSRISTQTQGHQTHIEQPLNFKYE